MTSVFGNYDGRQEYHIPTYHVHEPILHVTDKTTVEEVTEFYYSHRQPGDSLGAMTSAQRLEFYRHHLPKMDYKGFVFYMDLLARYGTPENFLAVRDIEITPRGQIKLYKVVPYELVTRINMEGFDPDAPKAIWAKESMKTGNTGKQYFSCTREGTEAIAEWYPNPLTLTTLLYRDTFNQAEFVFNTINQIYTSRKVYLE